MLDFKTQSQLVDATATIMRSYLRAATDTFAASASHNMLLWSQMLEATAAPRLSAGQQQQVAPALAGLTWMPPLAQSWWLGPSMTFWAPLTGWSGSQAPFPAWRGWFGHLQPSASRQTSNGVAPHTSDDSGFASYRSSGGHASAQVIIGSTPDRPNSRTEPPKRS